MVVKGGVSMIDLEYLGRSSDSETLVFTDEEGSRYQVRVSDELRSDVNRSGFTVIESTPRSASPGQIQTMLRQGLTPGQIAEQTGTEVSRVLRYQAPVLAEIDLAVRRATSIRVGTEPDSPVMGELVIDRLAARGVDTDALQWTASREQGQDWVITLTFDEGGIEQRAQWSVLAGGGRIEAIDSEAQQLTETVTDAIPVRALLPPLSASVSSSGAAQSQEQQERLLDRLNAARGKPEAAIAELSIQDDEDDSFPDGPVRTSLESIDGELDLGLDLDAPADTGVLETQSPVQVERESTQNKRGRRRPIPSWDEIVFGSRPE